MRIQLPGIVDFLGFNLPIEADLAAISNRVYRGFAKPPWSTLKHHLFNAHIPKKSFKSVCELCIQDRKDEFKQERLLQRVSEIHIPRTFTGLVEMDIVDGREDGGISTHPRYISNVLCDFLFFGEEKEKGAQCGKIGAKCVKNAISFFGTPDTSLADKDARFAGADFHDVAQIATSIYRMLFVGAFQFYELLKGEVCIIEKSRRELKAEGISTRIKGRRKNKQAPHGKAWRRCMGVSRALGARDLSNHYRAPRHSGEGALQTLVPE